MSTIAAGAARDYAALDDAELVACVVAGERDAFRQIMQRCNQRMFRVVRGVIRNEAEAEDVVQEAYVHAFEKLGSFRGEASLATWLTRIALNEAYGRLRRRRDSVDIDDIDANGPAAQLIAFPGHLLGDDPAEEAARAQMRRLLEQAVDELPEAFRLVYVLRDVEGCSVEDTAGVLGIRPETVKTRLHRARRQLRDVLASRVSAVQADAFQFMGARCMRMTEVVMARIAALPRTSD
ncbi:RNA polymerase sigma factor [Thermomonas sp.]|uniref:RNA polymerase sigma factor n=1 Tax=Thermomonas sp. TaxID=1971895 RepID=UPI001AD42F37|nr:RNA polymerase sigma factor [Xanthomonadales bacterium]MBN8769279.1 RNA polymerase sigma factor [Stenotrophomonas sp.]